VTIEFVPATRASSKARIALCGPSGSGKTYTGLALATRLSDSVGVVDTERGRASLYVGVNGWQFQRLNPQTFSPQSLTESLAVAAGEGFGCVLVDSWSHYWIGVDGMLEQVDKRAKGGNNFSGWKEAGPDERRMLDALVSFPGHVIVTLRVKTEYVIEENERGKKVPRKVGLKPIQRDGMEYEFDVVGDLDYDNVLTVSKSRIPALSRAVIPQPGPELADTIREWLEQGDDAPDANHYRDRALVLDDVAELKELFDMVTAAGLVGAPVLTADGSPTVLGDFIRYRATEVKQAAKDVPA
jgi:hypothetical protein